MLLPARFVRLTTAATLVAFAATSHAQTCPTPDGASPKLGQVDARERVTFLRAQLGAHARYAHNWSLGWFGINTAVLAGSIGLAAITHDPEDRTDGIVTSLFATVLPVGNLIIRLRVESEGVRFLRLDHLDTEASRCTLVRRGEQFLKRDAEDEAANNGWFTQVLIVGGNAALFVILGVGLGHWLNATLNAAGGLVLNELQFFSQPTGLTGAWKRYQEGDLGAAAARTSVRIAPQLSPGTFGLSVGGAF